MKSNELYMKGRQIHLDTIGGILICYMMLMHILLWRLIPLTNDSIWLEPLKFFMFWFFFKSGEFFRLKETRAKLIGGGKKLLVPFVVFSFLGYCLNVFNLLTSGDTNWVHYALTPVKELVLGGSIAGNDVLWFLTSLFMVQIIFNELKTRNVKSWLIVIVAISIAVVCHMFDITKPAYLANVSMGIALYSLGYMLRDIQYAKKVFGVAFATFIAIMLIEPSHIDLRTNTLNENGYYILALLFSICGCITVNNIFKHIQHLPVLTYIGKNSMDFYVMHMLVLGVITILPWSEWMIPNYVVFGVMCIASLTVPAFIGYLLEHSRYSWILGKTNK